jgi:hypothetical protein
VNRFQRLAGLIGLAGPRPSDEISRRRLPVLEAN